MFGEEADETGEESGCQGVEPSLVGGDDRAGLIRVHPSASLRACPEPVEGTPSAMSFLPVPCGSVAKVKKSEVF